jgi:hypothetical protein
MQLKRAKEKKQSKKYCNKNGGIFTAKTTMIILSKLLSQNNNNIV